MNDKRKTEKGIINGAFSLTVSIIIVKALGLIYKVPLSYILTDEGMGYFNTAYTVFSLFYIICTTGVPKAISILVSEADSEGDTEKVTEIYTTAFKLFFIVGLIISTFFLVLSAPISILIGNKSSYYSMALIAPSILFVCSSGILRGYFNGHLKFFPIAISEIISGASKVILGLALAYLAKILGYGFEVISAFTILGTTLGSFFGFIYLYLTKQVYFRDNMKQKRTFSLKLARKILKIAIPLTATSAIGSVSNIIDLTIIMKRLRSLGNTELQAAILYGNYTTLVIPMINLVATLLSPLSTVLLPLVSKQKNYPKSNELKDQISLAFKVLLFISVPVSILFLLKSGDILSLIFEDSSAAMAAPLLSLVAPGIIFMSLLTVTNSVLEGMGNTKAPMISLIFASTVKIIVSYILIGRSDFGLLGASIGTTASYFVGMCISLYSLLSTRKIQTGIFKNFVVLLFSALISFSASEWFIKLIHITNNLSVFLEISIFGFLYLFLLTIMGFFGIKKTGFMSKMYKKAIK